MMLIKLVRFLLRRNDKVQWNDKVEWNDKVQ
jgi:hypothetical protein